MAIITFMSDFGHRDAYVAAVKAKFLSLNPAIQVIDISHEIEPHNIAHAAFVLRSVFRDFPVGTVHLAAINSHASLEENFLAVKLEGHYFVGADNGLFSLLGDKTPELIIELTKDTQHSPSFPEKTLLATAAIALAMGNAITELGKPVTQIRQMLNRQVRVTKNAIVGNVIHIDHYGNLISSISKENFEKVRNQRPYTISFAKEHFDSLAETYKSGEHGDCIVFFNSNQLLEIAICQGNAAELLGLMLDSPVTIQFHE